MHIRVGNPAFGIVLLAALPASAASGADTPAINSRLLEIEYSLGGDSPSITHVELWITADEGRHWQLFCGADNSKSSSRSPIRLRVDEDGVYGLYIVLNSASGASSKPPESGQAAQQRVLVDTSAPLVQVKQAHLIKRSPPEPDMLVVSWTAYDAHLNERPVSLFYQLVEQPGWSRLTDGVPNIGRFDWPVPTGLQGGVQVKVTVMDLAGNTASDVSQPIALERQGTPVEPSGIDEMDRAQRGATQTVPALQDDKSNLKADPEKAQKLYELGLWHKQRGDYAIALERLLEATNLDPQTTAPAFELADMYYAQGNFHGALDIYQGIMGQRPNDREALRGAALAMVALGKYPEALDNLERVLRNVPEDAETWLHAGDVFLMMGQPAQARLYWSEALRLKPKKSDIAEQARKRLEKYALDAKNR